MSVTHLKASEVGEVPAGSAYDCTWKPDWRGGSYAHGHTIVYRVRPSRGRYVLVWETASGTSTLASVDFEDVASAQRFAFGAPLLLPEGEP